MATVRGSGCVVCCGSSWHFQLDPTYVRTSKWLANSYGSVRSSIDSYHMSSNAPIRSTSSGPTNPPYSGVRRHDRPSTRNGRGGERGGIRYGTYAYANKEAEFINTELAEQVQEGHVTVFPLEAVNYLYNWWLYLFAVIPQVGRRPRLIFDFIPSGINEVSKCLVPMEAMRFGGALQRILKQVITTNLTI